VELVSITSNEADNGLGDGDTSDDIQGASYGTDDRQFLLRAERSGTGSGRIYTVTYSATDASGNATETTDEVTVPH
jgi:endo-1,4-beta-xylanase